MVKKYKQDNDFLVLLEPVEGVVSISAGLWIKSGSRIEKRNQHGYAHFVEHMLFKGTNRYSARELARMIDRVGGQHNAATNREYTCFYINVISDHLELAIDVLSDMFNNPEFNPDELDKEKNVILEEIRMYEDTPDEFIHDFFVENMFQGHPLGHSILGSEEEITNASRDSLIEFYNDYYSNDNSIFVLSGNFDENEARELIKKYFNKPGNNNIIKPEQNVIQKPQRELFGHIERDLEQVYFCLGTEGLRRDDEDRWPLYALSTIFGGSMSSRLFQNIREKEGISYSIYSFHSSYSDNGIFGIYCSTSPDTCIKALELIYAECQKVLNHDITSEELEDTRTFLAGNLALSLESVEVRMGQLAKNEISLGRYYTFEDIVEKINGISLDDIYRVSDKLFKDNQLSMISIGNISEKKLRDFNYKF